MRWSEADLEHYLRRGQPAPLSEKAWQTAVMRLLEQHGYALRHHTFDARRSPAGWPDIAAIRPGGGVLRVLELKTDTGQVTRAQQQWLDALAHVERVEAQVLRPSGLEAFVTRLQEERL